MNAKHGAGGSRKDRLIVGLLGATFAAVGLLLAQAFTTVLSHERMIEATLQDFAGFAAEGIATELNTTFTAIFLDQISAGRSAHYAWVADAANAEDSDDLPRGDIALPQGAVLLHFSVDSTDSTRVIARGAELDADLEAWILAAVLPHASRVYPRPAPYAVLRAAGSGDARALVYRREQAYEGVAIYGFLVDFGKLTSIYGRVLDGAPLLPRSLSDEMEPDQVLTVELLFPQAGYTLFRSDGPNPDQRVLAEAYAAKAGRMMVRVELDAPVVAGLLAGGLPGQGLPTLWVLSLLTAALLVVAFVTLQRASRLARLREDFVANVSHDLKTPLAQIRMFSDTLLLGRLEDEGEQRRSLEIIRQQAMNLSDLVNNILHASGRDDRRLDPREVDLQSALEEVEDALGPFAASRSMTVRSSIEGAATARVDPGVLRRVLTNLIDNAIKYGPSGQSVTVALHNDGTRLEIVVDDGGSGVAARDRKRVWERFSRLGDEDAATTGTGLGLAVVQDLATRHGGDVDVTDAPGGGARFIARLVFGEESAL